MGRKRLFVGHCFLKQAKNRGSDWSLRRNAIACWFPHPCPLLKRSVRLIPAENSRTQLCLQKELAEEKSQSLHSQKSPRWAQPMYVTKEKKFYSECYKKVLHAGTKLARNILTNLSPNSARNPARPEKARPDFNSGSKNLSFFSKPFVLKKNSYYQWVKDKAMCEIPYRLGCLFQTNKIRGK